MHMLWHMTEALMNKHKDMSDCVRHHNAAWTVGVDFMKETQLKHFIAEDVTVNLYIFRPQNANSSCAITLAPLCQFYCTWVPGKAIDGYGRWVDVACPVGVQRLHAS